MSMQVRVSHQSAEHPPRISDEAGAMALAQAEGGCTPFAGTAAPQTRASML